MFVTNLTKNKLGIDGKMTLNPGEVNRYVDEKANPSLAARISRLERAKIVSVVREAGLTKTGIVGTVVKTITTDTGALQDGPRSEGTKVEAVKTEGVTENADGTVTTVVKKRSRRKKADAEVTADAE